MRRRPAMMFGTMFTAVPLVLFSSGTAEAATVAGAQDTLTKANYLALGDSYASGTGDGTYGTSGSCYRSLYAHPVVVSAPSGNADVTFLACNGATTSGIHTQILGFPAASSKEAVTYVTLTIGGNDAGFSSVITRCLQSDDCSTNKTFTDTVAASIALVPDRVAANVAEISSTFPNATIIVSGYPKLFQIPSSASSCGVGSFLSVRKTEANYLDAQSVNLNAAIRAKLPATVRYADVVPNFTGHGLCLGSTKSWINSLNIFSTLGAFHPNKNGQSLGYAPAVAGQVG